MIFNRCFLVTVFIYLLRTRNISKYALLLNKFFSPHPSTGVSTSAIKMASTRLPSPKSLVGAPTQILAQFPKQHQQSPKQQLHQVQQQTQQQVAQPAPVSHQQQPQQPPLPPGIKPTIQIKQESGNWTVFTRCNSSPVTTSLKTAGIHGYSFLESQTFNSKLYFESLLLEIHI